jgi:hypothetical protein
MLMKHIFMAVRARLRIASYITKSVFKTVRQNTSLLLLPVYLHMHIFIGVDGK